MRLVLGIFAAVPAVLLLGWVGGIRAIPQDSTAMWRTDWEKARVEARKTAKPLFVVFR